MVKHSCSVCSKACRTDCIYCEAADQGIKGLKQAVDRERLFLENVPLDTNLHSDFSTTEQDNIANYLLTHYHCSDKTALQATGDGSCLFNSVSLALCGNESRSVELRYRCCVEMVANKVKIMNHRMFPKLELTGGNYDDDCISCAKPYSYSPAWRILALSNLLNVTVETIYPAVNGTRNFMFRNMNTKFRPPFADPNKGQITIMWTSTFMPDRNEVHNGRLKSGPEWKPNHFVPLVQSNGLRSMVHQPSKTGNVFDNKEHHRSSKKTGLTSPNRFEALSVDEESCQSSDDQTKIEHKQEFSTRVKGTHTNTLSAERLQTPAFSNKMEENVREAEEEIIHNVFVPDLSTVSEESLEIDDNTRGHVLGKTPNSPTDSGSCSLEGMSSDESFVEQEPDFVPGPLKKFMDINDTLTLLKGPHSILNDVPVGRKDGMFYIVDNMDNLEKRKQILGRLWSLGEW